MHPIWNLIDEWLSIRNITLILIKVKGHSDDTFNQHVDELALAHQLLLFHQKTFTSTQ